MAGGTLGVLIPPSILAIIHAVQAEQSVSETFFRDGDPGVDALGARYPFVSVGEFNVVAVHGKLDRAAVREAGLTIPKAAAMVIWFAFGATIFGRVCRRAAGHSARMRFRA
ncbi:MAG: hypothetical protein AAGC92_12895 [Pseudomonadota bacterium]